VASDHHPGPGELIAGVAKTGTKKAKAAKPLKVTKQLKSAKVGLSKAERKSAKASLEFAGTAKKSAKRNEKAA